ncbi:D-serine ammonia-lyase [Liquorilactobacillus capillatus]|nr:D-serine ammonia-lyase [Liquorilactobacillus capillatus]
MSENIERLIQQFPLLKNMRQYQPIDWLNPEFGMSAEIPFTQAEVFDVAARFKRFAPYLAKAFPETQKTNGQLVSPLIEIDKMQACLTRTTDTEIPGKIYLKADSMLPISGSIKSRGGIYEVLKFAEHVAMTETNLTYSDNYAILATPKYHKLFAGYGIMVGSTGNLGLSIGMAAASFGFKTTVHMSVDARQWKKDLLRANGVTVVEHNDSVSVAIAQGRKEAATDPHTYFIDDEGSKDLFLGYSAAGIEIQKQLADDGIYPDVDHPVFVYLPAGVGGSPSGVSFGLQMMMPEGIYPVFAEPTHVPSVTIGMMTHLYDKLSVKDLGIDGKTLADGLAVPRSSRIAGRVMRSLLYSAHTFNDDDIYRYLTMLADTQSIYIEPSAAAGFSALVPTINGFKNRVVLKNATHIVWATGGKLVPNDEMQRYYDKGRALLAEPQRELVR